MIITLNTQLDEFPPGPRKPPRSAACATLRGSAQR